MTEETAKPETWAEKLAQMWWGVKVGERAENLRQAARRFDNVDSLVMSTREKLLGKETVDNNRPEGEDMHIGDYSSVTHQYLPPSNSTTGTLAKLALGAGLLTTGIGAPVGGYLISDALKQKPPDTDELVIPADQDTLFNLELLK
ncbi:hypothetical protein Pan153_60530 [Gimesia panareensis]|uniref:Uncharacterized protein n=1 Tax=Gimesia panareensis TaxID=2527978 RepID=A0A518FYB6_9PLAN|nr:hypothetical protein [Gimesia panareensis]QDV21365.1 hypothetical protein Pan153_60530 [Gimesia panareensis]